jgi:hypothetical protein
MANDYLPNDSHVVRHLSATQFDVDENGAVIVFPHAFELKPGEKYLSASWLEFYADPFADAVAAIVGAMSTTRTVKASHAFALGVVGEVKDACSEFDLKIRVIHEPAPSNPAYTAIRSYKSENSELMDLLARDAWSNVVRLTNSLNRCGPFKKR